MTDKIEISRELVERMAKAARSIGLSISDEIYRAIDAAPVVELQNAPAKLNFPTMLRKMWSGGEVQRWIDEQGPLYRPPENHQHGDSAISSTGIDGCSGDLSTEQHQSESPLSELAVLRQTCAQLEKSRDQVVADRLKHQGKPVAEVVSKFGDPEAFGEREIKLLADISELPYGAKLFAEAQRKTLRAGFCPKCRGSRMIRGTYGCMPFDQCC
ncbi:hypothetical protein ACIQVE_07295 [Pseudomonas sp. NPDC098747]|uniref:hypothetical protein n=1 Tax=Pseudomonas sp. NPDC098747 TaxID=3364487 RepID=UPI00383ADC1C